MKNKIAGCFDIETTDYNGVAFPYAVGLLDIPATLNLLEVDVYDCNKIIIRSYNDFVSWMYNICVDYLQHEYIPVFLAHNMPFDYYPLRFCIMTVAKMLNVSNVKVIGNSANHPFVLTYISKNGDEESEIFTLFDTLHLSGMNLASTGALCGIGKLSGDDFDYSKVRCFSTPLSEMEEEYIYHDIMIPPRYIQWLLETNNEFSEDMFAHRIVSLTSTVRVVIGEKIGNIKYNDKYTYRDKKSLQVLRVSQPINKNGVFYRNKFYNHERKIVHNYDYVNDEIMKDYWAITISANVGGFTFTAAKHAFQAHNNVYSCDAISMHPSHIRCHTFPKEWRLLTDENIDYVSKKVAENIDRSWNNIVYCWKKPFTIALKCMVTFTNMKLKGAFKRNGIGLIAKSRIDSLSVIEFKTDRDLLFIDEMRNSGYCSKCVGAKYAFSKLVQADKLSIYVTELELWCINQVYSFDNVYLNYGYWTTRFERPSIEDLESVDKFYKLKQQAKKICAALEKNDYTLYVDDLDEIPDYFIKQYKNKVLEYSEFNEYYLKVAKARLNSLYGIAVTNPFKSQYELEEDLLPHAKESYINEIVTKDVKIKVNYDFGTRIVGWSRIQQVIGCILLDNNGCKILSGDTDSLKFINISNKTFNEIIKPLNDAIIRAQHNASLYYKNIVNKESSIPDNIGTYEIEDEDYKQYDLLNKQRVMLVKDKNGDEHVNITYAGLRFKDTFIKQLEKCVKEYDFAFMCNKYFGFNTTYTNDTCRIIYHEYPDEDIMLIEGRDYLGNKFSEKHYLAIRLVEGEKITNSVISSKVANETYLYLIENGIKPSAGFRRI